MLTNEKKSSWSLPELEELGWELHPPGDLATWDGGLRLFVAYLDRFPFPQLAGVPVADDRQRRDVKAIRAWEPAARDAIARL